MFVDKAEVFVKAGSGGNGRVSFRQEKFIDRGGPDGGDGGKGGDVVLVASRNQNTLANFRYQKEQTAEHGNPGDKRKKHGRNGKDLTLAVPVGTVVYNEDKELIADLNQDGQVEILAKGGNGGFGNAHFISSVRQAPRVAEKGEPGEELKVTFELKMIADVGLVGLPNAGKSTLLASLSNATPEIADYPFTTIRPNLGVVEVDKSTSLLFADIPGLIEGASQGKGLGDDFLRHIERTATLVHLIDVYNEDVAESYKTIQKELKDYEVDLSKKSMVVVLNKIEGTSQEILTEKMASLQDIVPKRIKIFAISGKSKQGVQELLFEIKKIVTRAKTKNKTEKTKSDAGLPILRLSDDKLWTVTKLSSGYKISGKRIEKFAAKTDFENNHGVRRLRDIMKKMGIMHELIRQGIAPGNKITIGKDTFEY